MSLLDFFISPAAAQAGGSPQGSGMFSIVTILMMFAVMYFLMIRPQQKRMKEHREMTEALKKGDEIVTNGGLGGTITKIGDAYLSVKISDGVEVNVQRQAVAALLPNGTLKNI